MTFARVRFLTFLLLFLICLVLGLLFLNLAISRHGAFWQPGKTASSESWLAAPVEDKLLENLLFAETSPGHLTFALPESVPIQALFAGEVFKVAKGDEYSTVEIKSPKGLIATYVLAGEILVDQGARVAKGQVVARTSRASGPGSLEKGNLSVYLLKQTEEGSEPLVLSKEMFEKGVPPEASQ